MSARPPIAWIGVAALVAGVTLSALADVATPAPDVPIEAPVTDYADVIGPGDEAHIEASLRRLYGGGAGAVQMAVLTVPSTHGEPIEDFSHRVATAWAGGLRGRDNGVLLTLAVDDRRMRLEVGRGLEDTLPDHVAARIIGSMTGSLQRGDYGRAVALAVDAVGRRTRYEGPSTTDGLPDEAAPRLAARDVAAPGRLRALGAVWGSGLTIARGVLAFGLLLWLWWLIGYARARLGGDPAEIARRFRQDWARTYLAYGGVAGALSIAGAVAAWREVPGSTAWVAICAGLVALVAGWILVYRGRVGSFARWRERPRACPAGDGMMRRLPDEDAARHLEPGERTEHAIMSRIHDIWWCPSGHHRHDTYVGDSPAEDCPTCHNATLRVGAWTTEVAATYSHGGRESRTDTCAHCGETFHRSRSTPRKTRSATVGVSGGGSSGGGGWSGGGGSFGGGGASGSW